MWITGVTFCKIEHLFSDLSEHSFAHLRCFNVYRRQGRKIGDYTTDNKRRVDRQTDGRTDGHVVSYRSLAPIRNASGDFKTGRSSVIMVSGSRCPTDVKNIVVLIWWSDKGPERLDLEFDSLDLGCGSPDLGSEGPDFEFEKPDVI